MVVKSDALKLELRTSLHSRGIEGLHYGQTATIEKVMSRYWRPSVSVDVRAHVRAYDRCQKANRLNKPPPSTLHPIPVRNILNRWGIDLIGLLKTTAKGNKYIVVAMEYLMKWIEAKAIPDKTAEEVHMIKLYVHGGP